MKYARFGDLHKTVTKNYKICGIVLIFDRFDSNIGYECK